MGGEVDYKDFYKFMHDKDMLRYVEEIHHFLLYMPKK